jgi:hypothetical protein
MNKLKKIIFTAGLALMPTLALAQAAVGSINGQVIERCSEGGIGGAICRISNILDAILPLLVALGVIYLIWGVIQYVIGGSDEDKKKGRDRIVFGIIGLVVIVGLWGLVYLVSDTFGIGRESAPNIGYLTIDQNNQNSGSSCGNGLAGSPKFQDLLGYVTCIINDSVIPLFFALALAFFIWGAVKFFIINGGEEEKRNQGKQFMLWGIIALAVMLSVWGLVGILKTTFGIKTGSSVLPHVKPD